MRVAAETASEALNVDDICKDDKYEFGKILIKVRNSQAGNANYDRICALHASFHGEAGRIASMINKG
ncbi:MAG: hypothetical protein CSA70_04650 [Rhodobacterales bacterium]|nr:MAG: hypothetical protein CSA70_04650 [Rhodobacterales bacterium]